MEELKLFAVGSQEIILLETKYLECFPVCKLFIGREIIDEPGVQLLFLILVVHVQSMAIKKVESSMESAAPKFSEAGIWKQKILLVFFYVVFSCI